MLPYRNYSWIYKANYWQVAGGKFHWHNPQTNRVEDFNPNQVQGPHTKEVDYPLSDPKQSINQSRQDIAAAAQKIVDEWQQDEEGYDEEFGGGGACDAIANEISGILSNKGFTTMDGGQDGDDHAFVIAHNGKQAFVVDIPPSVYETGAGYSWTKRGDAKITPDDVVVEAIKVGDVAPEEEERKAAWEEWKEHHKPKEKRSHEMSFKEFCDEHKISGADAEQAWRRNVESAINRGENVSDSVKNEYKERQSKYDAARKQREEALFKPEKIADKGGIVSDWKKIKRTDPDDGYYYHVTSKENAEKIKRDGIIAPGKTPITGRAGFYQEHSRGKVFFTDRAGVPYWASNTEMTMSEASEGSESDIAPDLAVVRIPKKSVGNLAVDKPGSDDAKVPAYLSDKPIKIR